MRWLGFAALLLVLATRPARAEELTPQEKTWAKTCVDGLVAATPRQRESAAAALGRLGVAAMPTVFANLARLKTDEHWKALELACLAMGSAEVVAWLESSKDWPKACVIRLQALLDRIRGGKPTAPVVGVPVPASPADVAAQVTKILDSFQGESIYRSGDSRITQLVALGRPALGCLLEAAKEGEIRSSYRTKAAVDALEQLVVPEDLPLLTQMLADGHLAIGPALKRLPAEQAIPALLGPIAKGLLSFDLLEGLERFERDPRVAKALIAWLEGRANEGSSTLCGSVAELLARARAKDAVPVLVKLLGNADFTMSMRRIASSVTNLGDKRGVQALIDYFRAPPSDGFSVSVYERHAAGEDLNRVVGRAVYRGSMGGPGGMGMEAKGNFDEAAREFVAWWDAWKNALSYNEERKVWMIAK